MTSGKHTQMGGLFILARASLHMGGIPKRLKLFLKQNTKEVQRYSREREADQGSTVMRIRVDNRKIGKHGSIPIRRTAIDLP